MYGYFFTACVRAVLYQSLFSAARGKHGRGTVNTQQSVLDQPMDSSIRHAVRCRQTCRCRRRRRRRRRRVREILRQCAWRPRLRAPELVVLQRLHCRRPPSLTAQEIPARLSTYSRRPPIPVFVSRRNGGVFLRSFLPRNRNVSALGSRLTVRRRRVLWLLQTFLPCVYLVAVSHTRLSPSLYCWIDHELWYSIELN